MTKEFKPTYLFIKEHSITGLKYLCKTTRSCEKMLKYKGSGRYWNRYLKKHGTNQVETPWYCLFYDKDELITFALMCSEQWDIVRAKDENGQKIWANEKPENGLDGAITGNTNGKANKGKPSWNKGKPSPLKGRKNSGVSEANKTRKGRKRPDVSEANKKRKGKKYSVKRNIEIL